jgi:hypothetical protein
LRKTVNIAVYCLLLFGTGVATVSAQYADRTFTIVPYAEARRFGWEERIGDKRLLQENGMRYSIGAMSRLWFIPREVFFGELELCYVAGTADYDGTRMDETGHYTSYTATTAYSGIEGELLLGSTLRPFTRFLITPVAGAGIEYWLRNLDYKGPYGYTEKYTVPSLDAGIRLTYVFETHLQLFSTFLVRYPLSISETFTLAQQGQDPVKVVLHPGAVPQYRGSLGIDLYRVFIVLSYASWKLDESDVSHYYYQPESTRQEYGVKIGYSLGF